MAGQMLTGNQAVAFGALRAGVKIATGYPGTPSTGCLAHLLTMKLPGRHVEWSSNEKVAFEIAAGAAWAGHRALCTMKMSGVNVAYDALISIAYSGTNGGLVIYVADDPGVSAGMPEQDSRGFALMSNLPMLEPATPAEAYDLVQTAFDLSEQTGAPVFIRLTTAVALGHALVEIGNPVPPKEIELILERDITRYTKAGSKICLDQHQALIDRLDHASRVVHELGLNRVTLAPESGGLGIVAVGGASAYLDEACVLARSASTDRSCASMLDDVSILSVTTTIPFPLEETKQLLSHCERILVLEELEPHFERNLLIEARDHGFDGPIIGKLDGTLSPIGEYGLAEVLKGLEACGIHPTEDSTHERQSAVPASAGSPAVSLTAERMESVLQADELTAPRPITSVEAPHERQSAVRASLAGAGQPPMAVGPNGEPSLTVLSSAVMVSPETAAGVDVPQERGEPVLASTDGNGAIADIGVAPAPRPITVCAGCPHRGTYLAIDAAIKQAGFTKDEVMVTGDIGCTILGMNPPFNLLWNEVSMGSSIGIAQGYAHAGLKTPIIATMGDSTFFHGGIPGLINAIQHQVPLTLIVMDNGWTSMTGMQVNAGTDDAFQVEGRRVDIEAVIRGLGPDRVDVVDPFDLAATTPAIAEGFDTPGVKVVLAQRECAIQAKRRGVVAGATAADSDKCILCKKCLKMTGCPALGIAPDETSIVVDRALCNGCGLCSRFCPTGALSNSGDESRGVAT
ncbi:thiamine pyrophosphate-dependent enzyme [Candidatus Bipolaricaulota bacterium]